MAKETGWSEDYLMTMPIGRLWSYRHCVLSSYDIECYHKTDDTERQEMYEVFAKMKTDK